MGRLPNNSLTTLRAEIPPEHRKTITVQLLSDYLHKRKRPSVERSYILETACEKRGLKNIFAYDWTHNPEKIRQALALTNDPQEAA